ncbi:hypothetical protein PGQ11_012570 [Apiospora arundinis]|uniref:Uncharacterized protein n=1 Tax=Apiospora arundinis TaxID=335852 RepID=A0ABR2I2Q1_9PEZI
MAVRHVNLERDDGRVDWPVGLKRFENLLALNTKSQAVLLTHCCQFAAGKREAPPQSVIVSDTTDLSS